MSLPLTDPVYIFCVVIVAIAAAPYLAKLLRLPTLIVLIGSGTILGSNVTGILARDTQLILLEKIGLLYIMLLAGLQMDLSQLRRLGTRSLVFGCLTFSLPLIVGIISGQWIASGLLSSALLGILYSPHTLISYPIIARLGLFKNEAISVAIGGTIVTSVLTLVGLSVIQAIAGGNIGIFLWIKLMVLLPLLVLLSFWSIPKIGQYFINQQSSFSLIPEFTFILSCLFVVASGTLLLGIDSIVGAFIAGLALNSLVAKNATLLERVDFVGNSLFIPAFLISVGVLCNPQVLFGQRENLGLALGVIVGAVGGKFLAAWIAGKLFRYSLPEVMIVFGLTLSRAALVLVIALFGQQNGLLNEGLFNAIIFYILITCLIGPFVTEVFGKKVAGNLRFSEK
jgi:Kef-type K+ transport system membrane component KefB